MSYSKLLRRRFTALVVLLALLGSSVVAQVLGRRGAQAKVRLATRVVQDATSVLVLTERLALESAPAAARQDSGEPTVCEELIEEHAVAVEALLSDLASARHEALDRKLRREAAEGKGLAARVVVAMGPERRTELAPAARRLRDHLESLEDAVQESTAAVTAVLLNEHALALRWLRVGL